jgi:hypothetical protein
LKKHDRKIHVLKIHHPKYNTEYYRIGNIEFNIFNWIILDFKINYWKYKIQNIIFKIHDIIIHHWNNIIQDRILHDWKYMIKIIILEIHE